MTPDTPTGAIMQDGAFENRLRDDARHAGNPTSSGSDRADVAPDSGGVHATLQQAARRFQQPSLRKSLTQLATSIGGFIAVCAAMYALAPFEPWPTLLLTPVAVGFLVRTFIVQHDCGHRSFFRSRRANDLVGMACSLLTFVPYASWRRQHAGHHRIWNNLDRRQSGADIYSACLTVEEYRALPPVRRIGYRVTRHPLVANVLIPPLLFLVLYRLPFDMPKTWRRERHAVLLTNVGILVLYGGLGFAVGFNPIAVVSLPVIVCASMAGVWLFSVQHRFERSHWSREHQWSALTASLRGSSYLRLPRVLQWFTGNIGFHHIHHLNPRIPNYNLEPCHRSIPQARDIPGLDLWAALVAMRFVLWDEQHEIMVPARAVRLPGGRLGRDAA